MSDATVSTGRFANAAGEREYLLYSPPVHEALGTRSLLVMLHGCTQTAADSARGTRFNELAGARGWHVLYPEQSREANSNGCWRWWEREHQQRDRGEASIIGEMVSTVASELGISAERTYLAGISAGGAMASIVAATYPERFHALAVHCGVVYGAAEDEATALGVMKRGVPSPEPYAEAAFRAMGAFARVIPALVIQGGEDPLVAPLNGAQVAKQWFLTNALVLGQSLDTTSGATDQVTVVENGYRVTSSTHRAKRGDPLSHLVMIRELGHKWSGGDAAGSHTDPNAPDAGTRIVTFFESVQAR